MQYTGATNIQLSRRILTYNIHSWKTMDGRPNLEGVAGVIQAAQADIVGLNEVFYPRPVPGSHRPALELLAQQLNMHFVFGPCLRWPAQDELPADAYGNALLSRWPIIASAAHHLTPKEEDANHVLVSKEQRGLLEGRILLPRGETFTVYALHLDHTDEEARLVQLRVARTWLGRDRHRPHVVMGDFNAISLWDFAKRPERMEQIAAHPKGPQLVAGEKGPRVIAQMEKAGYVDLYARFGTPGVRSFLRSEEPIRIDYLFASASLADQTISCCILEQPIEDEPSDHRPVVAELDLVDV
jgi:endonuclease/exonuclease/phosphatase family metal-dependent hydrolase